MMQLRELSTADKNYLKKMWLLRKQKGRKEPSSLYVCFFVRMDDVSKRILSKVTALMTGRERRKKPSIKKLLLSQEK
jgi:hypothetical protein